MATLTTPIPLDARAGTSFKVGWRLFSAENGRRKPFGASGVFVRLLSASGGNAEEGFATAHLGRTGEYTARVAVPSGGVGDIQIGLQGWTSGPAGARRSDHLFPITNNPLRVTSPTELGLVYTPGYGNSILTRFDPLTLEPTRWRIRLGGNASSWSYSPGGNYLAIASYPQTLNVIDVTTMRSLGRVRLAPGGGVAHAVTWSRRDRVVAVVDTPRGALVVSVDPFTRRVVGSTQFRRPFAYAFERLSDGLAFLLGSRGRIAPAQLGLVSGNGRVTIVTVPRVPIGMRVSDSGDFEQRSPGLAIDASTQTAYLFSGDRVATVDLRTRSVTDRALRTLAKVLKATYRSASWLGDGMAAVWASIRAPESALRPVSASLTCAPGHSHDRPNASSFTPVGNLLLVENPVGRRVWA